MDLPKKLLSKCAGFTLVELLVAILIVAVIFLLLLMNLKLQIDKANDGKRKADLKMIQNSFEEYFNDSEVYPPGNILNSCGGQGLTPYLKAIPCDPQSRTPYLYVPGAQAGETSQGYRLCAKLKNLSDPDIIRLGCHPVNGCGWGAGFNYCLATGLSVTPVGWTGGGGGTLPTETPPPTPTPFYEGLYACTPGGACNTYDDPSKHGCMRSYANSSCNFECADPTKRCAD